MIKTRTKCWIDDGASIGRSVPFPLLALQSSGAYRVRAPARWISDIRLRRVGAISSSPTAGGVLELLRGGLGDGPLGQGLPWSRFYEDCDLTLPRLILAETTYSEFLISRFA